MLTLNLTPLILLVSFTGGSLAAAVTCNHDIAIPIGNSWYATTPWHFPWQVRLESEIMTCSGAIIAAQWVITTARCVYDADAGAALEPDEITAHFGSSTRSATITGEVNVPVSQVFVHDRYNSSSNNFDFALLKLSSALTFSPAIKPACLVDNCSREQPVGTICVVSGWGVDSSQSKDAADELHYGYIPIVAKTECLQQFASANMKKVSVTDQMTCAGYRYGDLDTCNGDPGSPLMCATPAGTYYLQGLTSFGSNNCGNANFVGVYSRVCKVVDWIKKITSGR